MTTPETWLRAHLQPWFLRTLDDEAGIPEARQQVADFAGPWSARELLEADGARLRLMERGLEVLVSEVDLELAPCGPAALRFRPGPSSSGRPREWGRLEIGARGESVELVHEALGIRTAVDEGMRWTGQEWVVMRHRGTPAPGLVQMVRAIGVGMWWVLG